MKKMILPVSIFFLYSALWGGEAIKSNYEEYIVVKYLLAAGDNTGAENVIDNYLKNHPEDPFFLTEKAYLLKNIKNDSRKAIELIEKSKKIYPDYYESNYLHAALLFSEYIDKKKNIELVEKAVEYLQVSLRDNKDFYNSYFLLGIILSETGKYEESNKYLELSNRLRETPEAYYNLSFNYQELGDLEKELATYKKILEFDPNNYSIIYNLAREYLKKRDYEKAVVHLEKLFLRDRENKEIALKYLYALFASGKKDKFLEISEKIDISGSSLLIHARAFVLATRNKLTEAEELLMRMPDKDLKANLLLADIYYRKHEYFQGYKILQKIPPQERENLYYSLFLEILSRLSLNRKISEVFDQVKKDKTLLKKMVLKDHYNILLAFSQLKEIDNVHRAARFFYDIKQKKPAGLAELLKLLPRISKGRDIASAEIEYRVNLFLIIELYKSLGRYDRAVSLLKKVIQRTASAPSEESGKSMSAPGDAYNKWVVETLYLELCEVYFQQENSGELEKLLEWLNEKFPGSAPVKNFYAYSLALQGRELEKALRLSAQALGVEPANIAFLDTYGYILLKLGRSGEAIDYLKKAYDKFPLEEDIIDHIVEYYRFTKEYKKIIEIYERAIEAGVDFKDRLKEKLAAIEKLLVL